MPTRNIKTVPTLALVIMLAGAWALSTVAASGSQEKSSVFYENALEKFTRGEYRATLIELKNARKEDPDNLSALVLSGRVYLLLGDGAAAEREFRMARRRGADDETILVWIAESLLAQRKYLELLEQIPIGGHSPELESKIRIIRGRVRIQLGNLDEAEDLFKEAARLQPDAPEPMVALGTVYLQQGKPLLAEDQADLATTVAPEFAGGWKLKGEIRRLQQDLNGALQSYDRAIDSDPRDFVARTARAAVLVDLNRDDQALEDIKIIRAAQPLDAHANYLYAVILARRGETEKSEAAIQRAAQSLDYMGREEIGRDGPTLLLAGNIHFRQKQFERAYEELDQYVRLEPNNPGARKMLGSILLMRGQTDQAVRMLEPALRMRPDDAQALALLGSGYMKQKRFSEATNLLEKAARLAPDLAAVRTQLAMVNLASGERDRAMGNLKSAMSLNPKDTGPGLLMGFVHLRNREYKQALGIARDLIEREPDSPVGYNLSGAALIGLGDLKAARSSFGQALKADNGNGTAHHNLAKLDLREGNPVSAERHYETAINLNSEDADALAALAELAEKRGDVENTILWLEKLRASAPDRIPEQVHLIEVYLKDKQPTAALFVARALSAGHPNNIEALYALSQALLANGDSRAAKSTYRTMARAAGYNSPLLLRIAKYQMAARDLDAAHWSLQKAVQGDPKYLPAQAELVLLDAELGDLDKALKRAAGLRSGYPKLALGHALTGDVMMRAKRFDEAVAAFEEGMQREPGPELAVRLYRARMRAAAGDPNRRSAAVAELEVWIKTQPDSVDALRTLGAGYIAVGRLEEARKLFQALSSNRPDDAAVLNNLAVLAIKTDDPKALSYARKAHKLAPQEPAALDTLGWALVQAGDPGRALQYLRDASLRASREPEIRYHLGVALHHLGRDGEARRQLKGALKAGQSFDGMDEARALLARLNKTS